MVHLPSHLYGHTVVKVLRDQRPHPSCSSSLTFLANIGFEQTGRTIRIHVARSRHIIRVELSRLLQLYSYLEFTARELYGKMGTRGADGTNSARGYGVIRYAVCRGRAICAAGTVRCPRRGFDEGAPYEVNRVVVLELSR